MAIGKRQQSNTMLYTVITFVALFLIAATFAVIYYVKAEDQRTLADNAQKDLAEMISVSEQRKGTGKIIGKIPRGKSGLALMIDYLDQMVTMIAGTVPEDTSAEVKVENVNKNAKEVIQLLALEDADPNISLVRAIEKAKAKLDETQSALADTTGQLQELQDRFDDATTVNFEKEQTLLAEKEKLQNQVNEVTTDYEELKNLMEKTADQRVQALMDQLDDERASARAIRQQLLKTQAEFKIAQKRMELTSEQLEKIRPLPDIESAAFTPDATIILIDPQSKIVHLNIGSDDRVYRGLTFSVYDKNMPIPKDGRGKAEIEVFNVEEKISAAQIVRSEKKHPIVVDDIAANLIWDSSKMNVFVVAGDFDLDGDGNIDFNGDDKIKSLVEKWGARVSDSISIDTDFVILGSAPLVPRKPTFEELEVYPMAMEKYQLSVQKLEDYNRITEQAVTLSIPIFNTERFLHLVGYKQRSTRPGAF